MVQGLAVAWWFSGEFDQIVNQSHDPNDRCDRVGAEEVSGPVLENTGGPPGRSLQLQVCQWCWKEIWRFEFVDYRRWSSSSKKWHFGWAANLRKPETRHWYFRWDTDYSFKQLLMTFFSSTLIVMCASAAPWSSSYNQINMRLLSRTSSQSGNICLFEFSICLFVFNVLLSMKVRHLFVFNVLLSTKVRHFFFDRMILEKLFDGKLRLGKDFPKL